MRCSLQCCATRHCTHGAQAEFNLDSWGGVTYYDLILAFYSLPIHIQPSDAACAAAGCRSDLNAHCERAPVDGRILSSSGAQVRLLSAGSHICVCASACAG